MLLLIIHELKTTNLYINALNIYKLNNTGWPFTLEFEYLGKKPGGLTGFPLFDLKH